MKRSRSDSEGAAPELQKRARGEQAAQAASEESASPSKSSPPASAAPPQAADTGAQGSGAVDDVLAQFPNGTKKTSDLQTILGADNSAEESAKLLQAGAEPAAGATRTDGAEAAEQRAPLPALKSETTSVAFPSAAADGPAKSDTTEPAKKDTNDTERGVAKDIEQRAAADAPSDAAKDALSNVAASGDVAASGGTAAPGDSGAHGDGSPPGAEKPAAKPATFSAFTSSSGFSGFSGSGFKFKSLAKSSGANPWAEPSKQAKTNPDGDKTKNKDNDKGTLRTKSPDESTAGFERQQDIVTGEEDEETEYSVKVRLYAVNLDSDEKAWKERGVGTLKLNSSRADPSKKRLLMRAESVLRVSLNLPLVRNTQLSKGFQSSLHTEKFLRISSIEDGHAFQFAVKLPSKEMRDRLYDELERALATI